MKGEVEIKVISKDGKVKEQIKSNAIYKDFAQALINGIASGGFTVPVYNQVELWFSTPPQSGVTNKSINATTQVSDTGSSMQVQFTAVDNSGDSYVVATEYIKASTGTPQYLAHASLSISKTSTDILQITWTISQPYG